MSDSNDHDALVQARAATCGCGPESPGDDPGPFWGWLRRLWIFLGILCVGGLLRIPGGPRKHLVDESILACLFLVCAGLLCVLSVIELIRVIASDRRGAPWATGSIRLMGLAVTLWVGAVVCDHLVDASDGWSWVRPCGHAYFDLPISRSPVGWTLLAAFVLALVASSRDRTRAPARACIGFLVCMGIVSVMARPGWLVARARANTRACYANQKTIAGAIEMYELDRNTRTVVLDTALFQTLRSGGYLQQVPADPGSGERSSVHYLRATTGTGVRCLVHGEIQ